MRNKGAIYKLLSANLISGFTQGLNMIAVPWYFVDIVNKGSIYGMLFGGITLITIFWTLFAGTLVDKFRRKDIFLVINSCGFLFMTSIGIYGIMNDGIPLSMVAAAFMYTIFVFNIHFPTVYAFTQEIVDPENYGKINSMLEIQGQSASMLAGALGAFLLGGTEGKLAWFTHWTGISVEAWDIYEIFLLDGITYSIAFFIILSIGYTPLKERIIQNEGLVKRFKQGISYLKENRALMWFGLMSFSVFIATIVEGFYLAAIYVSDYLLEDAIIYTLIEIAYAAGAIFAGVFIRRIFSKVHPFKAILIIMAFIAVGFVICGLTRSSGIFILFNFILGLSNAGIRILRVTFLFHIVPNHIIGRVNGIFASYQTMMRGAFILLFSVPWFLQESNIRYAYFVFAGFLALSMFMMIAKAGQLREMKDVN